MSDCELPQVFNKSDVKARKEYRCYECNRRIKKGEVYSLSSGLWAQNDGWETFKVCLRCERVRGVLEDSGDRLPDETVLFGQVKEELRHHTNENRWERERIRKQTGEK